MPSPRRRPPEDPGKPTPREAIAKATAAAGPRVAKAVEAATPKVEKAAVNAGRLLGTLRDRARVTAREFSDAYRSDEDEAPAQNPDQQGQPARAPRRRPRPSKD
jgi:hypothetical protein